MMKFKTFIEEQIKAINPQRDIISTSGKIKKAEALGRLAFKRKGQVDPDSVHAVLTAILNAPHKMFDGGQSKILKAFNRFVHKA